MDAIIGGTGTENLIENFEPRKLITGFGEVDAYILDNLVFIPRHKASHKIPPDKINYKAELACLEQLKVSRIIGLYAVGSINDTILPGNWGIIDDFIDFSGRNLTFHNENVVHTDFSQPLDKELSNKIYQIGMESNLKPQCKSCTYIQTNGPRLETPKEISFFKTIGADVVGMTAASEIILAGELGIRMAAIAFSINPASGVSFGDSKTQTVTFLNNEKQNELVENLYQIIIKAFKD